jgi:hypothetical protein
VTWTDSTTGEDGFKIERKSGTSGTFTQITTVGANVSSYIDSNVTDGTTYCYRVRAYIATTNSAYSAEACGTTPQPQQSFTLTVTKAGNGGGTVSSTPAGIACGADCSQSYASGSSVTLTAAPAWGSTFSGWSGSCSGTGPCTVILSTNRTATATFSQPKSVKIGVFRPSTGKWYLDLNGNGLLDGCTVDACLGPFGQQDDLPVVGHWDGTGTVQIGVFNPSTRIWKLDRNGNDRWDGCTVDLCFGPFLKSDDLPVVGRWTAGTTTDYIGIYRPSEGKWRLDLNGNGKWDSCNADGCLEPFLGTADQVPVVGDWTGTTTTKLGVFNPSTGRWKLDLNGNQEWDTCAVDRCLGPFGVSGDLPVAGDWSGTGRARIGIFDPSTRMWELDLNGNGVLDGCTMDACLGPFGQQGDLPVVGKW